jgi:hypothetical protein
MTNDNTKPEASLLIDARRQRIRRNWSASERKLRELRACVAQSRLALSILFKEMGCAQ